jgi:hypothetical protein
MARGKHATRSTLRANAAAIEHIDRLTDQVTDAKMRARQHEASTREVVALRARVAELQRQVKEESSPEVEHLRSLLADAEGERDACLAYVATVNDLWQKMLDRYLAAVGKDHRLDALQEMLAIASGFEPGEREIVVTADIRHRFGHDKVAASRIMRARRLISPEMAAKIEKKSDVVDVRGAIQAAAEYDMDER